MKAKSIKGKSAEEIKAALQKSTEDGFKPTLAIVFISIKQDRKAISEILHNEGVDILGATSCGEFIDGYQGEGSIVMMLLDLPRDSYTILFEDIGKSSLPISVARLGEQALQAFQKPSLIICSTGMNSMAEYFDGETLVSTFEKIIGPHGVFYGGMAGDDRTFTGTYVFTHDKETDFGLAALVLDQEKVELHGMAITGWKPLGVSRTVTKSNGNLIYTIDNKPAPEMYLKFLGKEEMAEYTSFQLMEELGMYFPFILKRETGGTVLRTPMGIDRKENALVIDLDIPEGTEFWFSVPPDFDIVENILDEAASLKNTNKLKAEALLIFSCAGRFDVLGPLVKSENEGLHEVLNTPMAGFFTYGEYGKSQYGKHEFHSGACCWVALKEKEQ